VGVDPPRRETPWDHAPRPEPEPPPGLSTPQKVAAGVFVAVLYAGGMIWRGYAAPGIVGGILAGIVMFLVLVRIEDRRRARGR
jgi:hypothetical protein